ncbi:MAG TPA: transcriptional regulator [Planctomycetes bacterium]|nr:transcriptional regulator [Planctomycetota bacterium]
MTKPRKTSNALEIIAHRYGRDPAHERRLREERAKLATGDLVRRAREARGLTQAELAGLIGSSQSAISRIEDADYAGHSVETLRKIANALDLPFTISIGNHRALLARPAAR